MPHNATCAFHFEALCTCQTSRGTARSGRIHTAHGAIETPVFMPVGTVGSVKAMRPDILKQEVGAQIILGNTYHLFLRPGHEQIRQLGGLHKFVNWPGPILTDSGGFQVFSLKDLRKLTEDGVTFKSPIDGAKHHLSPESATAIQHALDSTITMAFDECTPWPATYTEAAESMRLSMRWAKRSRSAFIHRPGYAQFGIQQGSLYEDLRQESTEKLLENNFEGYAIGGLAVGEPSEEMHAACQHAVSLLPTDKPRYLMGVGYPSDLIKAVMTGVDMFDCVLPTRNARNGMAFVNNPETGGVIKINNSRWKMADEALDATCPCHTCQNYSKAYLHHLHKQDEILSHMLLTHHNLAFYTSLMTTLRQAIDQGTLEQIATTLLPQVR